jgi:NADH dehydrogenase
LLLKGLALALDQFAFFPITRDQLTMLMEGNTCDGNNGFQSFDLEPAPFDTTRLSYLQRK